MLSWPALLLAPLIALGQLSIAYALVSPSCASQTSAGLHAVAAVSLVLVLALTVLAWRDWRLTSHRREVEDGRPVAAPAVTHADSDAAGARPHFVYQMAVVVGALSALVCAAVWLPIWILSPCY